MNQDFFEKGYIYLQKHFLQLENVKKQILKSPAVTYIHQARTTSRRLKSSFIFYEKYVKRKKKEEYNYLINSILTKSGKIRDLDVLLIYLKTTIKADTPDVALAGINRLILRISQTRKKMLPSLVKEFGKYDFRNYASKAQKIFDKSFVNDKENQSVTKLAIKKNLIKFVDKSKKKTEKFAPLIVDETNKEHLHEYRKEVKKQRYTLEFFNSQFRFRLGKEIVKLKEYQDSLGFIHDADVWLLLLDEFIDDETKRTIKYFGDDSSLKELLPGINYLKTQLNSARKVEYDKFIRKFRSELGKDYWNNIYNSLSNAGNK